MTELPMQDDSITLQTRRGPIKVTPLYFDAIEGWEIKRQLRFYLESEEGEKGSTLRRLFTLHVLKFCAVEWNGESSKLIDANSVNTSMESWKNINATFNLILSFNGIDPEMSGEVDAQAMKIGAVMGQGFWAQCVSMMGPMIEQYVNQEADKQSAE
jgi:hypothetical protein